MDESPCFADLILLGPGGKCLYNGGCAYFGASCDTTMTMTMPEAVAVYFANHGFPTPHGVPIAEWLLDVVTHPASAVEAAEAAAASTPGAKKHIVLVDGEVEEEEKNEEEEEEEEEEDDDERADATAAGAVDSLWDAYERELAPLIRRRVDDADAVPGLSPRQIISRRHNPVACRPERRRVSGFWRQLCVLIARDAKLVSRDSSTLAAIFGNAAVMGLLVGLVYLDVGGRDVYSHQIYAVFIKP